MHNNHGANNSWWLPLLLECPRIIWVFGEILGCSGHQLVLLGIANIPDLCQAPATPCSLQPALLFPLFLPHLIRAAASLFS